LLIHVADRAWRPRDIPSDEELADPRELTRSLYDSVIIGLDPLGGDIIAETWIDDYTFGFAGDGFLSVLAPGLDGSVELVVFQPKVAARR
jgi:hypothetical protein